MRQDRADPVVFKGFSSARVKRKKIDLDVIMRSYGIPCRTDAGNHLAAITDGKCFEDVRD